MIKGMINVNNSNWKKIDNTNYYISKDSQVYNNTGEYLCNISEPSDKLGINKYQLHYQMGRNQLSNYIS